MLVDPVPYSPYRKRKKPSVHTEPSVVPFVTARAGEDEVHDDLVVVGSRSGARLGYRDEKPADRDDGGALWARCRVLPTDGHGEPAGPPDWQRMHPVRQRLCMERMHCLICFAPAETPFGYLFLGPRDPAPTQPAILTSLPPVCAAHVHAAVGRRLHLEDDPVVHLAASAHPWGVTGTLYSPGTDGAEAVGEAAGPVAYGDPRLAMTLASRSVRRLADSRPVDLDELLLLLNAGAGTGTARTSA
ncbi:hypothetical protein ACFRI7_27150 [Streptomyces sp. NPDC056716]|uniref:hypothetical protein n=1 Tax=unclassified Streptomyces TaxID=2593676 RepID=UPI00367DF872